MRARRLRWFIAGAVLAAGIVAPAAANATITKSFPVAGVQYVDTVPVAWSTTTTPSSIAMVWTCTAGFCLQTISSPITLNLVSTSTSGSFTYNPSSTSVSSFSNWPGPMPDGTWSVRMQYTDATTHVTFLSTTASNVRTSTETLPPTLTSPQQNTSTNLAAIPIAYTLPSTPSLSANPTLTFTNTSTSAASVLSLSHSVTNGSFSVDPADLSASSSVLGVNGPDSLTDGTYTVTLSYTDSLGHAAATTTNSGWTLDRTTLTPSLSALAGGGTETGPFDVTFSLPETAMSGSVQLAFNGSPGPITLTLSDTSAGTHTVLIDPTALASSADVLSASAGALPAGSYTLAVAYQDALGNPASTSNVTPLTISAPSNTTSTAATDTTTAATTTTQPTTTTTTTTSTPAAFPPATGRLAGRHLGPIVLGMRGTDVRRALPDPKLTHDRFDRFRLAGGATRVGYPSRLLLGTLTAHQRAELRGRAILILTTVPRYHIQHLTPGAPLTAARSLIAHANRLQIGLNTWYAVDQAHRTVILKVAHDTVCEIGIAERALTRTHQQERLLLTSFRQTNT